MDFLLYQLIIYKFDFKNWFSTLINSISISEGLSIRNNISPNSISRGNISEQRLTSEGEKFYDDLLNLFNSY